MFVTDLKIPLLAREHRCRIGQKQSLFIAEDNLIEGIMKFEGDLNLLDLPIASVFDGAEYKRHFLIQEICSPAHLRFEKMNLRCVRLFRRAHGQRLIFVGSDRSCVPAIEHRSAHQQCDDDNAGEKGYWKPVGFLRRNQVVRPPISIRVDAMF